jgi:hypothetical protein
MDSMPLRNPRPSAAGAPPQHRALPASRSIVRLVVFACVLTGQAVAAQPARGDAPLDANAVQVLPASVTVGVERLRLSKAEAVGLLGVSYIAELASGWWLGPAIYGAATGNRGGLFTWGVEGQRRWRPDARWQLGAGLYVGGGGGAGAPVGGGLMLRPHADLLRDFGGWSAGISASQVRFPNGSIRSSQLGLLVAVNDEFAYLAPEHGGQQVDFSGVGGLGADRVSLIAGRYGAAADRGTPVRTVGMQLLRRLGPIWSATIEAAGAATGEADGYAEFLAGALALWPIGDGPLRLGVRAAVGLGGGGAVPTGGGPIAKAALAGWLPLGSQLSLGLEAGHARAFDGAFNSRYAQLTLGLAIADAATAADPAATERVVHDMQWAVSVQQYLHARRNDGSTGSLSTLGLKFQRALGANLYLTAQAHSAVAGGAGAYSAGMVGLGARVRPTNAAQWSVGAEALIGAGGGGGVASHGGAIVQPLAWIARDLGRYSRLQLGTGFVKSLRGDLSSAVIDLSWALAFGVP